MLLVLGLHGVGGGGAQLRNRYCVKSAARAVHGRAVMEPSGNLDSCARSGQRSAYGIRYVIYMYFTLCKSVSHTTYV